MQLDEPSHKDSGMVIGQMNLHDMGSNSPLKRPAQGIEIDQDKKRRVKLATGKLKQIIG